MNAPAVPPMFLPPVDRGMDVLDRSFFQKTIPLAAATIFDNRNIAKSRDSLKKSGDLLDVPSVRPTREYTEGLKCLLLRPGLEAHDETTWTPAIKTLVENKLAKIQPYDLSLNYNDWNMHNILEAVLPEFPEDQKETPTSFASVGHVAHVNLRPLYLPYRHLIGQVIIDKNPNIRTVINKTEDVGTESVFRTFPYEVLAGPHDLDVEVSESDCLFNFNFGKVYWNSRLNTEHNRLIAKFKEGEAVCDVMAGVGPFAVPAGKRKIFVWANDLNPDSFAGLEHAIQRNKVGDFVRASCTDGREYIRHATDQLRSSRRRVEVQRKKLKALSRTASEEEKLKRQQEEQQNMIVLEEPASFDHYVMNLPASAVEFLDAFKGSYAEREVEFAPHMKRLLPMVHVYLFTTRIDDEREEQEGVCEKVSNYLGAKITPDTQGVELWDVRLVSPKKKMYCASFRLPAEIAFANS